MNNSLVALLLAGSSLALVGTALATGPLAAFAASPVVLLLAGQAVAARRGMTVDTPRHLVGSGVATAALGAALALAGPAGAGVVLVLAGLAVVWCGTRAALGFDLPPEDLALPSATAPSLHLGVALDEAVKLYAEVTHLARRPPDFGRRAAEVRAAADRNDEQGWLDRPERAHLAPPPLEKPVLMLRHVAGVGAFEELHFRSEFDPQDPEVRDAFLAARQNRTACVYLQRHRGEPRPTLICLHGYGMGRIALDARIWDVGWLHGEIGLDVALVVLPLHGPRALHGRSGAGFFDGHPLWTNAALGQTVWELRRLGGWLRAQGAPAIGVFGLSLGGYAAALFASFESSLACAIPMLPISSLDTFVWRRMPPRRRAEARASGLSEHLLAAAWARHAPLRFRPRLPHGARLVVGGLADRIVPPHQVAALWEHWGRPAVHWFPGTHLAWVGRRDLRARIERHLRDTLIRASS